MLSLGGRVNVQGSGLVSLHQQKRALEGQLDFEAAQVTIEAAEAGCEVVWVDDLKVLKRAASFRDLSPTRALILAGLLQRGIAGIYTTDEVLAREAVRHGLELVAERGR